MIIVDKNAQIIPYPEGIIGRKKKIKVRIGDKYYIIKLNAMNNEIYAELIAERLGAQVGIEMAHYDVCQYNGQYGIITPVFLDNDKGESIISCQELLKNAKEICKQKGIVLNLEDNTVENIIQAITLIDKRVDIDRLLRELIKRWIFYCMIMESDKNATNISFIKENDNPLRLSPDYDNSTMARMNENIDDFITSLRHGIDIFGLTDSIKSALKLNSKSCGISLIDYRTFIEEYMLIFKEVIEQFRNLSVEEAIKQVEAECNISIPWNISFWLLKSIGERKNEMLRIFDEKVAKDSNSR